MSRLALDLLLCLLAAADGAEVIFLGTALTCQDAGMLTIDDATQCSVAARQVAGWFGQVHIGFAVGRVCGCVIDRLVGEVVLHTPPSCDALRPCSSDGGCFCRKAGLVQPPSPPPPPPRPPQQMVLFPQTPPAAVRWDPLVSCGGHRARSCELCTEGHGSAWCNGACAWFGGGCHRRGEAPPSPTPTGPPLPPEDFKCPGSLQVAGYGRIALVNAWWNVPGERSTFVQVLPGETVFPRMGGRLYFAERCLAGAYVNTDYVAWNFLGKKLSYTTEIAGTELGCNAALYLTSMQQNSATSQCLDHYCDANRVCGEACAEIDLQEANQHAWRSTLHVSDDPEGLGGGFGSVMPGWSKLGDWTMADYGPGSRCVDTSRPFQVSVSFPVDGDGDLEAMTVVLSQDNGRCSVSACITRYNFTGRETMKELSEAMRRGMTPVISYWSSKAEDLCADGVKFSAFSVAPLSGEEAAEVRGQCRMGCSSDSENCGSTGCCAAADRRCFEKDDTWSSCRTSCRPGIDLSEPLDSRSPWSCRLLGRPVAEQKVEVLQGAAVGAVGAAAGGAPPRPAARLPQAAAAAAAVFALALASTRLRSVWRCARCGTTSSELETAWAAPAAEGYNQVLQPGRDAGCA